MGLTIKKPLSPSFSLFTSILWTLESGFFLLDYHVQRLENSADYFGLPFSAPVFHDYLQEIARGLIQDSKVRVSLNKGGELSGETLPIHTDDRPVRVALAMNPIDPAYPFLYHKTTNRQVYEQVLASRPGVDDVILWNHRHEITESTIANIVVRLPDGLYTPPVTSGLLPGTYRAYLLDQGTIQERVITLADWEKADQVYLINSVRRWRECRKIN